MTATAAAPAATDRCAIWRQYLGRYGVAPVAGPVPLGMGDVTGGPHPDLLVRREDGSVAVLEADGCGGFRQYVCADCFDGAAIIGAADVTGDGLTDLIGVGPAGELLVFPHTGVFWPQDPCTTFGAPVAMDRTRTGSWPEG